MELIVLKIEEMLEISYYRNKAIEDYAKTLVTDKQIEEYYMMRFMVTFGKHILSVNAKTI